MEFSSFTFVVTDDCNLDCSYCYQKKGTTYLDVFTAKKAFDFFYPFFSQECFINFYGGEPLLAFEKVREIVSYAQTKNISPKKSLKYGITTNGSFLNKNVLQFLNEKKFSVLLSLNGSESYIQEILEFPGIELETNSVFTPETVGYLFKSMKSIIDSGAPTINISFSSIQPWSESALSQLRKELISLREFCLAFYKKNATIPIANFRENSSQGTFGCYAGKDRMDLSADGRLWGCCLFSDYFNAKTEEDDSRKYCFGDLDSFIENHDHIYPAILQNYEPLQMDYFYSSQQVCMLCDEKKDCVVCPVDAALGGSIIGKIPDWVCQIRRILREVKQDFLRDLEKLAVF